MSAIFRLTPATTDGILAQRVASLLSCEQGSVPFDREIGIPGDITDNPNNTGRGEINNAILAAMAQFEPTLEVTSIRFDEKKAREGILAPIVSFKRVEQ